MLAIISKCTPVLTALLFIYAGVHKLLYPGQATLALESLEVPANAAGALIAAIIVIELYIGSILLLGIDRQYALSAAMGVMFTFTCYLWYLSTLANPPSCGCLGLTGMFASSKQAALFGLILNCLVLWALSISYYVQITPVASGPPNKGGIHNDSRNVDGNVR